MTIIQKPRNVPPLFCDSQPHFRLPAAAGSTLPAYLRARYVALNSLFLRIETVKGRGRIFLQ